MAKNHAPEPATSTSDDRTPSPEDVVPPNDAHFEDGTLRPVEFRADETTSLLPSAAGAGSNESLPSKPALTTLQMVELNAFWFSYQLYWFLVFVVIVPLQVSQIAGQKGKGRALSVVSLFAGIINLFLAVFVGALNDRASGPRGKRAPYIIGGSIGMAISLFLLWPSISLGQYVISYALLTASTVVSSVPFNGLIADVTPPEQKAQVSSIMGGMNLLGYLTGAVVGIFAEDMGTVPLYLLTCTALAGGVYITVRRGPKEPERNFSQDTLPPIRWAPFLINMVSPLWHHRDFRLVFFSRFLFQLSIASIQQFMQYWIADCTTSDFSPQRAVSIALLPLFVLSPISAFFMPPSNRKRTVYICALLMTATCALLIQAHTFALALVASSLFGIGYGPFLSVEVALLIDVLPSVADAGKDMALWHSALVLPQFTALPLAGVLRDWGEQWGESRDEPVKCAGYKLVFGICIVYVLAGCIVTKAINLNRRASLP
ncbi:hypothetical protein HDU88_002967 [Geranomyces variabilis]|nr:hypothetical protein HDU88_002967 [Geranomyces variabilis]